VTYETTYPAHLAELQRRTEDALVGTGFDAVILCSGAAALKTKFDDQAWPLVPTPSFTHWCPLAEADAFVVVRPGHRPRLVRTVADDFWETTPPPESDHFWSGFEVVEAAPGHAHDSLPGGRVAVVTRDAGTSPPGAVNPPELLAALDLTRTRKTAYEIECLAAATRRAVVGHQRLASLFASGTPSELALHLAYLDAVGHDDLGTPYKNIVALGAHAAVLHYVAYESRAVAGDTSLLVDAGAKVLGYGSDITRTSARGSSAPARRFADLIALMDSLQQQVIRRIRPGLPYEELHDATHVLLASVLLEAGLCRGSAEDLVASGVTRAFLPHGLGHSLGVQVHDVGMKLRAPRPENRFLRNTSVIEIGQVFTIEPGLYFIPALLAPLRTSPLVDWAAVDSLAPFGGIRIEDNVLVGDHAIRNLTREAFAA
jgi:Xaa-Pro dipeptidase